MRKIDEELLEQNELMVWRVKDTLAALVRNLIKLQDDSVSSETYQKTINEVAALRQETIFCFDGKRLEEIGELLNEYEKNSMK